MSANRIRWSVVFLASLFVFAQLAVAAQGCFLAERHGSAMADEQCASVPMESGACMIHCVGVDQSASAPDHPFAAAASSTTAAPLDFLLVATRSPSRALCDSQLHVPRSAQVLFCSYQT